MRYGLSFNFTRAYGYQEQPSQISQQPQLPATIPPQQHMDIMTRQASTSTAYCNLMGGPVLAPNSECDKNVSSNQHRQDRSNQRFQESEPPKPKEPIPSEHQILQDVFDGLKTRCLAAASHPVNVFTFYFDKFCKIGIDIPPLILKPIRCFYFYCSKLNENLRTLGEN